MPRAECREQSAASRVRSRFVSGYLGVATRSRCRCAVTAVPPPASARAGTSQLAADAGWYIKRAAPPVAPPAAPYCLRTAVSFT